MSLWRQCRPSWPSIILGSVMMITGLILAWPSLYGMMVYDRVRATILDVYDEKVDDPQKRKLTIVFDYKILGADYGLEDYEFHCMGTERCDVMGQALPPLVVQTDNVYSIRQELLHDDMPRYQYAYFDRSDPINTGRLFIADGRVPMLKESLGMILLITPLLTWSCIIIGLALRPRRMNRNA